MGEVAEGIAAGGGGFGEAHHVGISSQEDCGGSKGEVGEIEG